MDNLLEDLDTKFDDMTAQFIDRSEFATALTMYFISHLNVIVDHMSSDVDKLESSIQDIINSDVQLPNSMPQSPAPGTPGFGAPGSLIKRAVSASANAS